MLAACASTPVAPKTVIQTIEIPVAMPCAQEVPQIPLFCFPALTDQDDIFVKVRCLLSDRKLSLGYETELLAKLKACK